MEFNPIVTRELRTRWRGWGSFALVFGIASVLALIFAVGYSEHLEAVTTTGPVVAADIGDSMFRALLYTQALGWMLLAPALTATSIVGERERGLFEAVQISSLSPTCIVTGKLGAAMLLIALAQVVAIPTSAVCFLIGGVAPSQLVESLLLLAVTAATSASIGLCSSAWARRSRGVLGAIHVLVIGWLATSYVALTFAYFLPGARAWYHPLVTLIGQSNPLWTAYLIGGDDMGWRTTLLSYWPWWAGVATQMGLGALCLALAVAALRRPMTEEYWIEPRRFGTLKPAQLSREEQPDVPARATSLGTGQRGPEFWTWENALVSSLRLTNPILQRELRSKLRVRSMSVFRIVLHAVVGFFLLCVYLGALYMVWFYPESRPPTCATIAFIWLFVLTLVVAGMGAGVFTRERESNTWESLRLSLASPFEIVVGKLGAILLTCLAGAVATLPLVLPCIRSLNTPTDTGVALSQTVAAIAVLASAGWAYSLWGMLISWSSKSSSAASGKTLATLLGFHAMLPVALGLTEISATDRRWWFHGCDPILALAAIIDGPSVAVFATVIVCTLAQVAMGAALFCWLCRSMHRRNPDGELVPL